MDEVDDLVVTPFREIVDKAKTAVENAGEANPVMLKAAQSLLKEGERGVKRIEPLCRKHVDDYGYNFIAFLKDNDEIAQYRSDLTDLLWEFDDYIEPDDFDADKFTELQALSRKAAPRICDLLRRAKLEAPVSDAASSRGSVAQLLTPTSPPTYPGVLLSAPPGFQRSSADSSGASLADINDATSQLRGMMRSPSAPEGPHPRGPPPPPPPPPKAPTLNPWDWQKPVPPPPAGEARTAEEAEFDRRVAQDESPVLPAAATFVNDPDTNTEVAFPHPPAGPPPPPASVTSAPSEHGDEDRRLSATSQHTTSSRGTHVAHHYYHHHTPSRQRHGTLSSFSIPENEVSQQHGAIPYFQPTTTTAPASYPPPQQHSRPISISNRRSGEADSPDLASLASYDPRGAQHAGSISMASTGSLSPRQQPPAPPHQPPPPPQKNLPAQPAVGAASASVLTQMDAGPIPVEAEEASKPARPATSQAAACRIGDDSSFQLAKGFCDGAKDVTRGGIGVKRTKKQGFSSQNTVARCLGCLFELDFGEIEADVKREDKGNHSKVMGINYRIRFLQKSHLTANRVDDVQYGCVFCVQQGYTIDKSDATVFFSQKSLFDHLARHPRPLPHVPGLTVIEGDQVPEKHHNDYDIHFRAPPVPHPVAKRAREIASQPTGVAREQSRRLYGQRLLYDRSPALELAKGARLTGITWPVQYQGEWIFAWHDGNFASVPADLVKLDPPPSSMVRYDRTSMVCARAKWKFAVKEKKGEKGEWLKFDKNDTITNIAWVDADCWCWTGTNSKGKTGLFPQAYLDADTVHEPSAASSKRAASASEERARSSSSMLSKLSSSKRKNSGRPPSISNSVGSR